MPKQPPAPGTTPTNAKPIYQMTFAQGDAEPTKNYIKLDPQSDGGTGKAAILIGNNGQLYLRTDLMPKNGTSVKLTITAA